jgi:hypothetical protein
MSANARRQFHEAVALFLTVADSFDYDAESTHQTHGTLIQHKPVNDQTRATTDMHTIEEPLTWRGKTWWFHLQYLILSNETLAMKYDLTPVPVTAHQTLQTTTMMESQVDCGQGARHGQGVWDGEWLMNEGKELLW